MLSSKTRKSLSVGRSVGPSVGPSVTSYFFGLLGATYAVYTALFHRKPTTLSLRIQLED